MKKWAVGGCVAVLLPCGILLFACVALMASCGLRVWPTTRTPPVDMYGLMIDLSAFPENWRLSFGPVHPPKRAQGEHGEREMLMVDYDPAGFDGELHGAYHRVFRYRNQLDAAIVFYLDFNGGEFLPWHMVTQWAVPEEWLYESPAADRLRFACGEVDMSPLGPPKWECAAVAQYDEYVSVFRTELSPDYMTLEDVERILLAIDERMSLHLGKQRADGALAQSPHRDFVTPSIRCIPFAHTACRVCARSIPTSDPTTTRHTKAPRHQSSSWQEPRPRAFLFRLSPGHPPASPPSAGMRLRRKLRDGPTPIRSNGLPSVPACLPHIPRGSPHCGAPRPTAVLSPLGISHQNLALSKAQVLDPHPHAFH